MFDANELLAREEFVHGDCLWQGARFTAFEVVGDRVVLQPHAAIDLSDRTDVFALFTVRLDGATYVGGEASSHGSCGFFCKRVGARLEWIVISTTSEPFVDVEVVGMRQRFRARLGDVWVVEGDALDGIRIERAPLRA